jgi:predicted membrane-bound spermidine synthase
LTSERRTFLGVALISMCVLMLQLSLTRLFSATMHYHFAFLAISLALFGSAASGVFVYALESRLRPERTARWLALAANLMAPATLAALLVVLRNPVMPEEPAARAIARLTWIYAAAALPFFLAGCVVTLAIARMAHRMSRLYLFDLGGAAAGCLLLIPVLNAVGASSTVLLVGALAALAGASFASASPGRRYAGLPSLLLALTFATLAAENVHSGRFDVRWAKGQAEDERVLFSRWNSFSRVTVRGQIDEDRLLIEIDSDAAATLNRDGHRLDLHQDLRENIDGIAYHLKPQARALIIGPGGGNDVIVARVLGAASVTAVEVNPIIALDVMSTEPFRSYSGALYEQPGVRLVVDEGRSFLRRSQERYDVVQATMVDTWAATAAGAFALTENNLYTVEAFREYLARLAPGGMLSMTRWHQEPPDQLLRLVALARASLEELGLGDPAQRLALVNGRPQRRFARTPSTFLLKRDPFTADEIRQLDELAERFGFEILYSPATRPDNVFTRLIEANRTDDFFAGYPNDVTPTRDNNPFFFHSLRLGNLVRALRGNSEWHKTNLGTFVLFAVLALTSLLTLFFVFGPLLLMRRRLRELPAATTLAWLLCFASLGAGFILVEVALVQKCILFLGHPVYSLSVVLFSLLVFSALGSALSGRLVPQELPRALPRLLVGVAALIVVYVALLSPVFHALVQLGRAPRIALCVSLLAPLGLAMGAPMPTAIRILADRAPGLIPWAWGVNGAASVLGSVAALALAIVSGFDQTLLAGAALYVAAMLLGRAAR